MEKQNQKNKLNPQEELLEKKEVKEVPLPKTEDKITLSVRELEELKKKASLYEQYSDKLLRLGADFENCRKRWEREKQEFIKFAQEAIILELLNILDDLERLVEMAQAGQNEFSSFLKGVELILTHLYELLKKYGVKPIEAKGKSFDPQMHEAMMEVENKELPEHTIVEELQKGYLLHERVIRTAKVKVTKKSETRNQKPEDLSK